jgi:hypothetical protein
VYVRSDFLCHDRLDKLNQRKLWKRANGPDGALYLQRKRDELFDYEQVR